MRHPVCSTAAQKNHKTAPDPQDVFGLERAKGWSQSFASNGHGFVDHNLGGLAQAIGLVRLERYAQQGCLNKRTCHQKDGNSAKITELIGLDNEGRTGFAQITLQCDCDQIATFHAEASLRSPARSSSTASRKTASSMSWRSAARTRLDWRAHSTAKPGARVSGTQIWMGRKPAARRFSRRLLTRLKDEDAIIFLPSVTCSISLARLQSPAPTAPGPNVELTA